MPRIPCNQLTNLGVFGLVTGRTWRRPAGIAIGVADIVAASTDWDGSWQVGPVVAGLGILLAALGKPADRPAVA